MEQFRKQLRQYEEMFKPKQRFMKSRRDDAFSDALPTIENILEDFRIVINIRKLSDNQVDALGCAF